MLHPALFYKLEKGHYVPHRQAVPEFQIKGVVMLKVIIGSGHLKETLGADQFLALHQCIMAPATIAGIKKRDKILQYAVCPGIVQRIISLLTN